MNILQKAYCRIYQGCFRLAQPILPYRDPALLHSLEEIPAYLANKNIESVLVVTDEVLCKTPNFQRLLATLEDSGICGSVYSRTQPNPTVDNANEAREIYFKNGCRGIIAFGGGSAIDCAKAAGALVAYPKSSIMKLKGLLKVRRRLPELIAIPTTAGTGSEVTVTAVITDSVLKRKYTMNNFTMIPRCAVHDPAVTYSLPPHITAATGMDAITHAIEAYLGRSTTKETRKLCLDAIKTIFQNIETAYNDGENFDARKNMLEAAYKAGLAFSKSYVGYIHAVAHSLGGQYNTPHGLANAVLLPVSLEYYGSCIHKKLKELAVYCGISDISEDAEVSAKKFIEEISALNMRLGIPRTISDIRKEDIPKMAGYAAKEANPLYPVPRLMTKKEIEQFYIKVADWS